MTPSEELLAQRDAVMFGKHVRRRPAVPGEACAVERVQRPNDLISLNTRAVIYLEEAVRRVIAPRRGSVVLWNDTIATRQQVIDALEEAARMAKEAGE